MIKASSESPMTIGACSIIVPPTNCVLKTYQVQVEDANQFRNGI